MTRLFLALLLIVPRALAAADLPRPITDADFMETPPAEVTLGQLLFYDPILSGNRNISCASCHHPRFGTSDGLSLGIGEGGIGLGPDRALDPGNMPTDRIPRNSTGLWNLGAHGFTVLFHDGRIEADPSRASGIRTPMGEDMEQGFSGVLAAQTMFPVLSAHEMAGQHGENDVSKLVSSGRISGEGGAWDTIADRVAATPDYQKMFEAAYPDIAAGREIAFHDIANALAVFIAYEWRSDDSPFDAWLRGEADLPTEAKRGMELFYGEAGCAECHSGAFQTDHSFHAMGLPQIGPGKKAAFEFHSRDVGRMRVTGDPVDAYRFRTPSLRNVALTGPYGHDGAFADLRDFVAAHCTEDPAADYDRSQAVLPALPESEDWAALDDPAEAAAIASAIEGRPVQLSVADLDALLAFLNSLTGYGAAAGRLGIPDKVPSGLPVDR